MAQVTIPTASYVRTENNENLLLPELLPAAADFNQQCKLWRFYCTCLDLGCPAYKLEDFLGKQLSFDERYIYWVDEWKLHYHDVSQLIRAYKKSRIRAWFFDAAQKKYRQKLSAFCHSKGLTQDFSDDNMFTMHLARVRENLEKLKQSAQHLLNARFYGRHAYHNIRSTTF